MGNGTGMGGNFQALWRSLVARRRWLTVGLGIKRWLLLLVLGSALMGIGWLHLLSLWAVWTVEPGSTSSVVVQWLLLFFLPVWLRILLPWGVGGLLIFWSVVQIAKTVVAPLRTNGRDVVDSLYDFRKRDRGPHIVAIGGGTGLPSLLRGLTAYTSNITAIVTVADDGGSSGRLRRELGLLPPGDFRNNIAALAQDESLLSQLLQYRFSSRSGENRRGDLHGHAFGNLLLAALTGITGSFEEALPAVQRVLAMRGQVVPSTLEDVTLIGEVAVTAEGGEAIREVVGESAIPEAGGRVERVRLEPPRVQAYPPALRAIFQADLIVLGPGSLYTSILPNLLVPDLAEALQHTHTPKVYVCNLAMQPGETDGYTVADHVDAILRHTADGVVDLVLANDRLNIPAETGGGQTRFVRPIAHRKVEMLTADLVDEQRPWRHDSQKLAAAIMGILTSV